MQLSSYARKAAAVALTASTVLWAGVGMVPQIASASVHSEGCLVLSGGIVWMITGGMRRGYTSAEVFQSYGYNFSQVTNASAEDVALPVGPIMIYADGTLVKGPSDPLVYLVTGGQKRPFVSGAVFTGLGFSFANIQSAPYNTFSDLPTGSNLDNATMAHPAGVQVISNGAVWWMDNNGRRGFASGAQFNAYGYKFSHVVAANAADLASPNLGDVPNRPACTGGDNTTPPPVSGSMSVTLASDNPAGRAIIANATHPEGQADLAHFTFWGNAVVNSLTLKRTGISADTSLGNVYLFDGGTRVTDASTVSSGSLVTFNDANGLFTVNGSKTISVRADVSTTASAGETVGIQLVSAMSGNVAFSGTPVSGNTFNVASATLATLSLGTATGSGSSDPGNDVLLWQSTATIGTRDVLMTRLALRQIGSINTADINTFKLYLDGQLISTVNNLDSNGYATFNVSQALRTGARVLKVTANVVGGSSRTVQLQVRGAYDLSATDTQYNVGIIPTTTSTFPLGPVAFTVNSGSTTTVKTTDSQSQNLTLGASDQSLAKYTITAFGEPVKVQTLNVGIIGNYNTNSTLRNVKILVNGTQVGSTTNVPLVASFAAGSGTQFTTNFTVVPGTPATVEIRGDMVDTNLTGDGFDNIAHGDITSVQAVLIGGTGHTLNNGTPQVSLTPFDVPTVAVNGNVLGNTLTIASGSMSLAQTSNYGNQTIVTPQYGYKIGSYILTGNATEAVNLNTIYVAFGADTANDAVDLSNLYVQYGPVGSPSTQTSRKGTVVDNTAPASANSFPISYTLPVNGSLQIDVYADVATSLSTNTVTSDLAVAGVTAQSGISTYADTNNDTTLDATGKGGQNIVGGSGTIAASADASTPNSAIVVASGTVTTAAFKFAAGNDSYTVTDMTVGVVNASAVTSVSLMDGSTPLATLAANTSVAFHGLTILVPANGSKVITVQLTMGGVGVGAGTTGSEITTSLTAATARNSAGTNSTPTGLTATGNAMYAYKATPTITNVGLPTSLLVGGGAINTMAKFTISSNGGTISWSKLLFNVSKSVAAANATVTLPTLWDVTSGSTQVTTTGSFVTTIDGANNTAGSITIIPTTEQQISGSKTYELRATIGGTIAANDVITTQIKQVSSNASSTSAFKLNAASGYAYYDFSATPGTVAATDIRAQATSAYTAANVVLGVTTSGGTYLQKIVQSYGVTGNVILNMAEGSADNTVGAATFTVTGAGASDLVCTPFTGVAGIGAVSVNVTLFSAVQSITCTGANKQILLQNLTMTVDSDGVAGGTFGTLTITKAANSGVGTSVLATDSDFGLTTAGGVATAANFVWSDVSAASHSLNTSDWTNAYLVQSLPANTQSLQK